MIFLGDGLSALGGAVARWALVEGTGKLLDGGLVSARRGADFPSPFLPDDMD